MTIIVIIIIEIGPIACSVESYFTNMFFCERAEKLLQNYGNFNLVYVWLVWVSSFN